MSGSLVSRVIVTMYIYICYICVGNPGQKGHNCTTLNQCCPNIADVGPASIQRLYNCGLMGVDRTVTWNTSSIITVCCM